MVYKVLCAVLLLAPGVPGAVPDSSTITDTPFAIAAGFGVSLISATDIVDYINGYTPSPGKVDDFGTAVEFFGASEFRLRPSWGLKVEYAYLLKSYNVPQAVGGEYTFSYHVHMPTAVLQYRFIGEGYALKVGGGGGYHMAVFSQNFGYQGGEEYSSHGFGLKLDAEGNTAFDEHFFGYIAIDIRKNFMSALKGSDGKTLSLPSGGGDTSMSFFSIGLKFGFIYLF